MAVLLWSNLKIPSLNIELGKLPNNTDTQHGLLSFDSNRWTFRYWVVTIGRVTGAN